jgi:hypothetical protein
MRDEMCRTWYSAFAVRENGSNGAIAMAVSGIITPGPQLGPAPAVPAGNFTKVANDLTRDAMPHHAPVQAPPPSQRHKAEPVHLNAGHKVDHKV